MNNMNPTKHDAVRKRNRVRRVAARTSRRGGEGQLQLAPIFVVIEDFNLDGQEAARGFGGVGGLPFGSMVARGENETAAGTAETDAGNIRKRPDDRTGEVLHLSRIMGFYRGGELDRKRRGDFKLALRTFRGTAW